MTAPADQTPEEIMRLHPEAEPSPLPVEPSPTVGKKSTKSHKAEKKAEKAEKKAEKAEKKAEKLVRKAAGLQAEDDAPAITRHDKIVNKPAKKLTGKATIHSSEVVFEGKVFNVTRDQVTEPGGVTAQREVVRHHGSVVILAVDRGRSKRNPNILLIRQYRHAANGFLLELPAGRIESGEKLLPAAKRELLEETGYTASRWSKHITYYASPGFLSEAMNILLAEDLTAGEAQPEDDERIEIHMTPLKEVLDLIRDGKIQDGKTLIGVLAYADSLR